MRRITGRIAVLATALLLVSAPATAAELGKGDTMPSFELEAADGKTYSLDTLRGDGSLVLIVYRGVW